MTEHLEFILETEHIKLDSLLKCLGLADSGGHAKSLIRDGQVKVNREVVLERGKKLRPGDRVELGDEAEILVLAGEDPE